MKNRMTKFISQAAYSDLMACGAANGSGNRSRTMLSKRDKQRKASRRTWRQNQRHID